MLLKNRRHILFFDLVMKPHPSEAPAIPLDQLTPHLQKRVDDGLAFKVIDNEQRVIRLSSMKQVELPNGEPAVALLFCLGDKEKADAGVTNIKTGDVRLFEKEEDEVGGLSVHAVIQLRPTTPNGFVYRTVMEDVTGFGRTPIQTFLRSQFRDICDDQDVTFPREDKKPLKTWPLVELAGHASEKLKTSISEGRLLHLELITYAEIDIGMDEGKFLKAARQNLSLSVSKKLPQGDYLDFLDKVKVWAKSKGYDTMRVRWKDDDTSKPHSAKVDTAKADAGEAFFLRTAEVTVTTPLAEVCAKMSDELIEAMKKEMA
ncbi:hypothetical protein [Hoeflea alexandrii]|uniref:Uncharacterized protein n=1 Tax=Hoeflea alexandrii TaxID=288436 RepID=A0ABT1CV85_9HYPH|nr:hypothetical protein [Hoeflea alexandrii]MCO6410124.1 hypothetical protein [Hoeflea alexandrii]MCY0153096.1 hypothetical protein [Hoeflea alexandrii]